MSHRSMKALCLTLAISLLCAATFTGSAKAQAKVSIRVMTRWAGSDPTTPAYEKIKKDFLALNPDIEIVDESIPDNDAYNNKLKSGMATGNIPDIFALWTPAEYAKAGMLLDLSKYMDEDKAWSGGFVPGLVDTVGKVPNLPGIFEFPMEVSYEVMYYNPDVFAKAGVTEIPKTFDDLLAAVKKIQAAGFVPIGAGAKEAWRLTHIFNGLWMKSIGAARGFDLGTGKTKFDDPDVVEVLARLKQLVDAGAFDKNMGGIDYASERNAFFAGKIGMVYNGTWFISDVEGSPLKDTIKVFLMPGISGSKFNDNDILYAGGWAVSNLITSDAERATAIKFVKYLSGQPGADTLVSVAKRTPTRRDITVDLTALGRLSNEINDTQKDVKIGGTDIFAYTLKAKMETIINNNIVAVALGSKTPAEAAKVLADEMKKD